MGLADIVKKKLAKGEKIVIEDVEQEEKSIGQALAHLHPNIQKQKGYYQQWAQTKQPHAGIVKGKRPDLIASHTGANPLTGLQGTADMAAMRKIKKAKTVKRRRPGR